MKRILLVLAAVFALGAFAVSAQERTVVDVMIGSDTNILDFFANTVKPAFEEAYPQYELNLVHTGAEGGTGNGPIADRAFAGLETGDDPQVSYFETFNPIQPIGALEAGLWLEITEENVPNLSNVNPAVLAGASDFSIPYRGSQVILAYNEELLLEVLIEAGDLEEGATEIPAEFIPSTFPELMTWACDYPGQFIYPRPDTTGAGREFVTRAILEANGLDTDTFTQDAFVDQFGTGELTNEQLQELNDTYFAGAWDILNEVEPCLYNEGEYPSGSGATGRLFADELVSMISIWSDQALQNVALGVLPESTRFIQLEDLPMVGGYAASTIPTNASNLEGALALADFLLSSEMQEAVVRDIGGFPAASWDTLPPELQEDFNDVITEDVPAFAGIWKPFAIDGWYSNVASDLERGN
jgi:putative spermidine/putrescine transport system substrate-binding protein